ncbi:M56 family metallopeptidase [Mangrovivirga cuniculi]|uniref:Peptidase M56 domain-containing protein n=1 Tax=Mangrovivirga cuniculi TaxID=2715131 RepID=A0A4D7JSJ2_9BACT|nr:M56 family metallopeptidase [Mangrovivirga cuniculi]QCK15056.1 hypothetical protein DCC35_10005 [Mangrovivirga cuniculi]
MNEILLYVFEVSICQAIFYLFYRIFLAAEIYFQKLRLYLTGTLLASFLIPLVSIPVYFYTSIPKISDQKTLYYFLSGENGELFTTTEMITTSLFTLFIIGVIISLIFLTTQLLRLYSSARNLNYSLSFKGIKTKETEGKLPTFSFINTIYFDNSQQYKKKEKEEILLHEYYHIKDRHSIDLLIHRIASAILWFSPFIYWQKNALESIQEYIADSMVLKNQGGNKEAYGALIVKQLLIKIGVPIANFFAKNKTLKRVEMMKYSGLESEAPKLKWTWVILSVLFLCFSFNIKEKEQSIIEAPVDNPTDNLTDLKIDILPASDSTSFISYDLKSQAMIAQSGEYRYMIKPVKTDQDKEMARKIISRLIGSEKQPVPDETKNDEGINRLVTSWFINEITNKIEFKEKGQYYIRFSINHDGLLDFAELENRKDENIDIQLQQIIDDSPQFPQQDKINKRITMILPILVE